MYGGGSGGGGGGGYAPLQGTGMPSGGYADGYTDASAWRQDGSGGGGSGGGAASGWSVHTAGGVPLSAPADPRRAVAAAPAAYAEPQQSMWGGALQPAYMSAAGGADTWAPPGGGAYGAPAAQGGASRYHPYSR
jgi:hypothetical protein